MKTGVHLPVMSEKSWMTSGESQVVYYTWSLFLSFFFSPFLPVCFGLSSIFFLFPLLRSSSPFFITFFWSFTAFYLFLFRSFIHFSLSSVTFICITFFYSFTTFLSYVFLRSFQLTYLQIPTDKMRVSGIEEVSCAQSKLIDRHKTFE